MISPLVPLTFLPLCVVTVLMSVHTLDKQATERCKTSDWSAENHAVMVSNCAMHAIHANPERR